ncbi:RHS repeat-associated core domain-containing protein [bacterium]|nr:RHS repeat-associated core domain-containing protein [bacterium]
MAGLPIVTTYAYDNLNRLTREATCDYMDQYTFDAVGNRAQIVRHEGYEDGGEYIAAPDPSNTHVITKTYQYDDAYRLTRDVWSGAENRTKVYYWDAGGRLTRQEVDTTGTDVNYNYYWDALDRMTYAQTIIGGVTKTIRYDYNAAGLRTQRVVTTEANKVTKFWTYQGVNIASVQETTPGGGIDPTKDYVYMVAPGQINNALERHHPDYAGNTTDSQYYQYDHRGNVVAVTDENGDLLHTYHYDAYGHPVHAITAGSTQEAPTDDILFTGKDLDPDTGLYYFNARWYDAETGRFIQRAHIAPHWESRYMFCEANPMGRVDPRGTRSKFWGAGTLCTDPACKSCLDDTVLSLPEDDWSKGYSDSAPAPGECADSDGVAVGGRLKKYTLKIPDNCTCTIMCDGSGNPDMIECTCTAFPWWKRPVVDDPDFPENPFL